MIPLRDIFDIAADAFLEGRDPSEVLVEAGPLAEWYWVIGPTYGRPRPQLLLAKRSVTSFNFATLARPLVREVFSGMIANEIVSVQPMTLPAGLLFYMDYRYESRTGSLGREPVQETVADAGRRIRIRDRG